MYVLRCEKQLLWLQVLRTSGDPGFEPNRLHQTLATDAKLTERTKRNLYCKNWFSITWVLEHFYNVDTRRYMSATAMGPV